MPETHQNGKKKTNHEIGLQNINSWVGRKVENIPFLKPSEDNALHKREWAIATSITGDKSSNMKTENWPLYVAM